MRRPHTTARSLWLELDSLVATLMGEASPDAVNSSVTRLETALQARIESGDTAITACAVDEVRSAIDLLRGGKSCAAVSALLAARSALGSAADQFLGSGPPPISAPPNSLPPNS